MKFGLQKLAAVAFAAVIGLTAQHASAATVTFDFTGSGGNLGNSTTFSESGIDVLVESTGGQVRQVGSGLGVSGGPDGSRLGSNANVNETLAFTFTPAVTLLSGLVLEHGGGNERFDILDQDMLVLGSFMISGPGGSNLIALPDLNLFADTFVFRHTSGSGIRVNSLTVAPVPLPAGGLLLLSGFGGIAVIKRRRRKAAA